MLPTRKKERRRVRRRPWTAGVALVSYVGALLSPSLAAAQEADPGRMRSLDEYSRVDGGNLSSSGDRAGAVTGDAARGTTSRAEVESEGANTGQNDEPTRRTATGQDGGAPPQKEAAADGEGEGPAGDASQPPEAGTATLALPSGGDKSGVTSQTISIPKGAGSIKGMEESFSAQLSTGIATFSVPFALMKARGGASPSLGLSYSSAGGNGPAGQGWSVGVPFIARQTDRGLPKYLDGCNGSTAPGFSCRHANSWHPEQDHFVFNGGQELVPVCTVIDGVCDGAASSDWSELPGGVSADALVTESMPDWAEGYQYFRPRVEGSFLRFFWAPDHRSWIVQDKSGTIMELGDVGTGSSAGPAPGGLHLAHGDALETNPDKKSEIYRWHLSRQYDQHREGDVPVNLVVYDYDFDTDDAQAYLTDIFDTTPSGDATTTDANEFAHHTRLRWEERPDKTEGYRSGWRMVSGRRLVGVDVTSKQFMMGELGGSGERKQVRRYHLSYDARFHRSLLTSVQVEGRCTGWEENGGVVEDGAGQLPQESSCGLLPPMTFSYSEVEGYQPDGSADGERLDGYMHFDGRVAALSGSPDHSIDEGLTDFFDIDSDGLPDVLVTAPGLYNNGHAVFFNGADGTLGYGATPAEMGVIPPKAASTTAVQNADANTLKLSNLNVSPLDLDGDGRVNLLHMPRYKEYAIYDPLRVNGKWNWVGRVVETASGQNVKIDFGKDTLDTQVVDVNFDGLVDVAVATGTEYQTFFSLGRYANGDGQFGSATWTGRQSSAIDNNPVARCVPHSGLPVRFSDGDARLSDMNGDGIPDIVRIRRGDIQYWPGRGNGFWGTGDRNDCEAGTFGADRYVEMDAAPYYSDVEGSTLRMNDVNGDGLTDLVQIRFDAVDIWLNVDGTGWTKRHILDGTPYHAGYHNRVRLTDMNGSGTPDIVWGDAQAYKYIDLQGGDKPYILTGVSNGLGKTTALEYSTSVAEMLSAAATGNDCGDAPSDDRFAAAWCSKMPTVAHVVKRVIERDNLTIRGRPPAEYVTEYQYRDPVYEGRQREFRGFARARAIRHGDANSPTDISESVFLLGECRSTSDGSAWDGVDQKHDCAPPQRWRDNPFEALKGLPVETHKMDASGVHLASTENEYTLRTLYEGLDGRAVRHAFLSQTDSLLYDTGARDPERTGIERLGFADLDHQSATWTAFPQESAPGEYRGGMAHLRTSSLVDVFGNKIVATNSGCVGGSACPDKNDLPADEVIHQVTRPTLVSAHPGGWLWRTGESYTTGSMHTELRGHSYTEFDGLGRPIKTSVDIFGPTGSDAASSHRAESASVVHDELASAAYVTSAIGYDAFGNAIITRGANGRCAMVSYGGGYGLFATTESIETADIRGVEAVQDGAPAPCESASGPETLLTTSAAYDHGLGVVTLATDLNLRNTLAVYDEFGRITALHKPSAYRTGTEDPEMPGQTYQAVPSVQIEYFLPPDLGGSNHSIIHTRTQDGPNEDNDTEWIESYVYVDGFGRTLVTLSEADPDAGDGGDWIAGSLIEWDQKSAVSRKYLPFFWSGNVMTFDYSSAPTTPYGRQRYDAFGRQVQTFDLDGTITLQSRYHALSTDLWDAADLTPGPHQHSYASERKDGHGRTVRTTERFRDHGAMEQRNVQTTYLTTGEPEVIRRVNGSGGASPVTRWMRYDSLGRMVLNVEPNTTTGFTDDPTATTDSMEAWRYQYNVAGDLVATTDARGCGQNFYYDGAGRILGEDYAPCEDHQAAYSEPTSARDATNLEVTYYYDRYQSVPADLRPNGWTGSDGGEFTVGRAIAVLDRGSASFTTFDGRGRTVRTHTQVARPVDFDGLGRKQIRPLDERYAPRVYERTMAYDAADREVSATTGVESLVDPVNANVSLVPELLSAAGESTCTTEYTERGTVKSSGSSYGSLVGDIRRTADNLVTSLTYGDVAETTTAYLYDERRRISSVQTYRGPPQSWQSHPGTPGEPTQQMVLQDEDFLYDVVGNPVEVRDWRDPAAWPQGAKPVTKKIEYDDLYRATRIRYQYAQGDDDWVDPHAADASGADTDFDRDNNRRGKPSPRIQFTRRMLEQSFEYDWVGNNEKTTDDADGFYDRSLGDIESDAPGKPYQLKSASGPNGHLEARYDAAGNMTSMALERDGICVGGTCDQRFVYDWDEVGRLVRARRWDMANPDADASVPGTTPAADLRNTYDASDQRVIKEAVETLSNGSELKSYTLYVFASMELRRSRYGSQYIEVAESDPNLNADYEANIYTVAPYLMANGVRLARLVYHGEEGAPEEEVVSQGGSSIVNASTSNLHVFFELGDHLGSTSVVLDKATGELVERSTFQGYGGAESDYRPDRWKNFREDYKFTGKEEDVEVGLQYFGKRFLNPLLGRWVSADPLEVHSPGEADLNLYSYVRGTVLKAIDPLGLAEVDAAEQQFLEHYARVGHKGAEVASAQSAQKIKGASEALLTDSGRLPSAKQMQGDHIVSLADLRKNAKFRALTLEQQLKVANHRHNLLKIDAGVNASKNHRSLTTYLDDIGSNNKLLRAIAKRAEATTDLLIHSFAQENAGKWGFNRFVENARYVNKYFNSAIAKDVFDKSRMFMSSLEKFRVGSWVRAARVGASRVVGKVGRKIGGKALSVAGDVYGAVEDARSYEAAAKAQRINSSLVIQYDLFRGFYVVSCYDAGTCG